MAYVEQVEQIVRAPVVLAQRSQRPDQFQHLRRMSQGTLVAARHQLQHQQQHDGNGAGVQSHLQFLDDYPFDLLATSHLGRRHQPVESEQQRHELALPGRPDHIGQRFVGRLEHQAFLGLHEVDRQREAAEHALLQERSVVALQTVWLRKQRTAAREFPLHQQAPAFAEGAHGIGVAHAVALKRSRPAIGQGNHALRGDEECGLVFGGLLTANPPFRVERLAVNLDLAVLVPDGPHAFAETSVPSLSVIGMKYG